MRPNRINVLYKILLESITEKTHLIDSNIDGVKEGSVLSEYCNRGDHVLFAVQWVLLWHGKQWIRQCLSLAVDLHGMQDEVQEEGWKGVAWFLKIISFQSEVRLALHSTEIRGRSGGNNATGCWELGS
jgi:hypothetical protein